ncbi:bifunctional sterol desaturase/short chain dehydrogenase [Roseofilum sp. BLCC_M143]|uniref:Bifunctional sterol desaturase/short chain dehydrogenase n=2 Tax=Roseofilum TaxID=1233426 RepID=A0ABT7C1X6_9CYAN|nr:bifunctional sterol desaturase/short chain dehydrogenase [Roseofilum casamattae]MDJ1185456.1 bifunctional sterol desaturase/short chain dehydrogenase [Roseofilum casamattae BLCC-M143]
MSAIDQLSWMGLGWGILAIILTECVRDGYHALSHVWKPLHRLHVWHHRVFRPDLTTTTPEIYQKAHWYNDVPESLVMLAFSLVGVTLAVMANEGLWGTTSSIIYSITFLLTAMARGLDIPGADELTDSTHRPGAFDTIPSRVFINRTYHWRHHFDNQNAYFCGTFTFLDRLMGTALSLKGKTVAVTGASGTLGRALLHQLHRNGAKAIALTSGTKDIEITVDGKLVTIPTLSWSVGNESALEERLKTVDILLLNHGINVHGDRSEEAISQSYQVNTFSSWRLMELFLKTVKTNRDIACKEVWINTSEAEVSPAFSPLYEMSKRTLGELITMRRLDAPCIVRKLILGPFKSNLNPIGIMSADWVAGQIINQAKADSRNIIVTINPITFIAFPIKEWCTSLYFQWFSQT